jgi:acyl-CoA thioesterase-1
VRWSTLGVYLRVVMAGCLLAGCGKPSRPIAATAKDSGGPHRPAMPSVLLIGTSLTAGYGLDPRDAWATLIQDKVDSLTLGFRVINAGVSGESSADALHRVDWLLSQGAPAAIVIETGANDALRGAPVDSVRAKLESILDRFDRIEPHPVIIVAGMEALPNLGRQYGDSFRAIFPAAAHAHHDVYLPFLLAGVAGIPSLNQADGIHPNAAGSRRVAANVWHVLGPIIDSLHRIRHDSL